MTGGRLWREMEGWWGWRGEGGCRGSRKAVACGFYMHRYEGLKRGKQPRKGQSSGVNQRGQRRVAVKCRWMSTADGWRRAAEIWRERLDTKNTFGHA